MCTGIQGTSAQVPGGPSAKVCSSAKHCVLVLKASMLYVCGGSICQSVFICQALCTGIEGIYALCVWGVHLPSVVFSYSRHLCSIPGGSMAKGDLPIRTLTSILHVQLYKYQLSELKSLIVIWEVFQGCFGGSGGATPDMILKC